MNYLQDEWRGAAHGRVINSFAANFSARCSLYLPPHIIPSFTMIFACFVVEFSLGFAVFTLMLRNVAVSTATCFQNSMSFPVISKCGPFLSRLFFVCSLCFEKPWSSTLLLRVSPANYFSNCRCQSCKIRRASALSVNPNQQNELEYIIHQGGVETDESENISALSARFQRVVSHIISNSAARSTGPNAKQKSSKSESTFSKICPAASVHQIASWKFDSERKPSMEDG